jgi:iron complex outermembrane receptor protein
MYVAHDCRRLLKGAGALLLSASLLAAATSAQAQTAPGAETQASDSLEAGDAEDQISEITVFARKRAEDAQSVPIPVTIITAQELSRQNLVNFTNFQAKFPSFSVYLTNPKQLNLGVRGIGNNGFNTDGIDGSVGVFVDGVYTGRLGMVSTDFNDIAQVDRCAGRRARCSARTPPPAPSSSIPRSPASSPSSMPKPAAAIRASSSTS